MWVRGLKLCLSMVFRKCGVAPHVGAWIETTVEVVSAERIDVAPHVGAWIETSSYQYHLISESVAPHVGAWIETCEILGKENSWLSHPMWVRGLKLKIISLMSKSVKSHPMWVRGLKLSVRRAVTSPKSRTPCGCVD